MISSCWELNLELKAIKSTMQMDLKTQKCSKREEESATLGYIRLGMEWEDSGMSSRVAAMIGGCLRTQVPWSSSLYPIFRRVEALIYSEEEEVWILVEGEIRPMFAKI